MKRAIFQPSFASYGKQDYLHTAEQWRNELGDEVLGLEKLLVNYRLTGKQFASLLVLSKQLPQLKILALVSDAVVGGSSFATMKLVSLPANEELQMEERANDGAGFPVDLDQFCWLPAGSKSAVTTEPYVYNRRAVAAAVDTELVIALSYCSATSLAPGGVFLASPTKERTALLMPWEKGWLDLDQDLKALPAIAQADQETALARLYQALLVSLSNYFHSSGLNGLVLGLSGGIDSALAATLATDALGKDKVTSLYLPAASSSELSARLAAEQAGKLGIRLIEKNLTATVTSLKTELNALALGSAPVGDDINASANLTARLRAVAITYFANLHNSLILATSNRTEIELGYFTLYGDSCGGYAPLASLPKSLLYQLATWRNQQLPQLAKEQLAAPLVAEIIARPPTAELVAGQTDEQDLGMTYGELDYYLGLAEELPAGVEASGVKRQQVHERRKRNLFKQYQLPPGPQLFEKRAR